MSNKDPGTAAALQNGLSFAEQLQGCFAFGILMVDEQGRITAFDAEAERMTRSGAARMPGGTVHDLPASLRQIIEATISTGKSIVGRPMTLPAERRGKIEVRL